MAEPTADELALLLSEGLDLCVRAKKLDEATEQAVAIGKSPMTGTTCLTPALWVIDENDLESWEGRARHALSRLPMFREPGRPSP